MLKVDCLVIGAGVIGLAIGRAVASAGREVIVLERESGIGLHTSSRNSEVIHAGIYNLPGWKKSLYCVSGRQKLYRYCEEFGVPFRRCGKFIIASNAEQIDQLKTIRERAHANQVTDVEFVELDYLREQEPALNVKAGLFSPSTGIIDSHALMLSLQGEIERHGGHVLFKHRVVGGEAGGTANKCHTLHVETEGGQISVTATTVVNAAGLYASELVKGITGFRPEQIPQTWYAKGNYFKLNGRSPFRHLIYPVPEKMGLGIHLTLDMQGNARFGPDVEWIDAIDYRQDVTRAKRFYDAIRLYWPELPDGALSPDYTGIRPKLATAGEEPRDFLLQTPEQLKIPQWVNLFGIESPGLTSCLHIADQVRALLA